MNTVGDLSHLPTSHQPLGLGVCNISFYPRFLAAINFVFAGFVFWLREQLL
jgi:hypothetical protein